MFRVAILCLVFVCTEYVQRRKSILQVHTGTGQKPVALSPNYVVGKYLCLWSDRTMRRMRSPLAPRSRSSRHPPSVFGDECFAPSMELCTLYMHVRLPLLVDCRAKTAGACNIEPDGSCIVVEGCSNAGYGARRCRGMAFSETSSSRLSTFWFGVDSGQRVVLRHGCGSL